MERKAVYAVGDNGKHLVCVCKDVEDAQDIAEFFQKRDRGTYQYVWTDNDGNEHNAN